MAQKKSKVTLKPGDFGSLYENFNAPISRFDCGRKCAPLNNGEPVCCSTQNAVPVVHKVEFEFLKGRTDLWSKFKPYDFATRESGPAQDPAHPLNQSPLNTGPKDLPEARPAWIFYPYTPSARFPSVGSGGRTACAGPFYRFDPKLASDRKLPESLDQSQLVYDWERHWILAVKVNPDGSAGAITPLKLSRPVEGPDGLRATADGRFIIAENRGNKITIATVQGDTLVLEGYLGMLDYITRPYEIPYRILIPEKIDGLIVPVAASTTHVAFSSIRMEPTWMALGQTAGVAAHLAIGR